MMGATVGADQSSAALMNTLTDPKAFADRLKQLTAKSDDALKTLEEAKQSVVKAEAERQKAEEISAATYEMVKQVNVKEADLVARETALAAKALKVANAETDLVQRENTFKYESETRTKQLDTFEAALKKQEEEFKTKSAEQETYIKQLAAEQQAAAEAKYQANLRALDGRAADLAKGKREIDELYAKAIKLQNEYEQKLTALKQLASS